MAEAVEFYFFGYDGVVLTKEEYLKRVEEHRKMLEREEEWRRNNPDFEYDW